MNRGVYLNKRPKVSVIIPVYNSETYLRNCLDSLINQSLRDIEIICVDDGSTDHSFSILLEYQSMDSRIIVLRQNNAGAGAARNRGLQIAKGTYLSYLDSDDFFELNMLEEAVHGIEESNADIAVFASDCYDNNNGKFYRSMRIKKENIPDKKIFSYLDIYRNDIFNTFSGCAWDKLFKAEFVKYHRLYFQEQRTTNDMYFVFTSLVKANKIIVIDKILMHYRKNLHSSLSGTKEYSWDCLHSALNELKKELISMNRYEALKKSYISCALFLTLEEFNSINHAIWNKYYAMLRNNWFKEYGIHSLNANEFCHKIDYIEYLYITHMQFNKGGLKIISGLWRFIWSLHKYGLWDTIRRIYHIVSQNTKK